MSDSGCERLKPALPPLYEPQTRPDDFIFLTFRRLGGFCPDFFGLFQRKLRPPLWFILCTLSPSSQPVGLRRRTGPLFSLSFPDTASLAVDG